MRRSRKGVTIPTWVFFAGVAAVVLWLLTRSNAAAASTTSTPSGQWWTDYDSFMNTPPVDISQGGNIGLDLENGVSGGSH